MQPKLFEKLTDVVDLEAVILYALGGFQSCGKILAERELAYDRLRGAFLRAFSKFGLPEPTEETIVETLKLLGAKITHIPTYVAKRPYRIETPQKTASRAKSLFQALNNK